MAQATGINFVIKVEVAGVETIVAGQRGATLNRSADTTDRTTKDTNGWKAFGQSFKEWSIEGEGLLAEGDAGWKFLEDAFESGETVAVSMVTEAGNKYEGEVIITDLPIEAPYDDEATYSFTFQGTGALAKVDATP